MTPKHERSNVRVPLLLSGCTNNALYNITVLTTMWKFQCAEKAHPWQNNFVYVIFELDVLAMNKANRHHLCSKHFKRSS